MDRQSTTPPLAMFESAAQIGGACGRVCRIGYVQAANCDGLFWQYFDLVQARGWWREEVLCGPDAMTEMPEGPASPPLKECAQQQ